MKYESQTYAIIGACFEVYKRMGPGFLEAVYQECLALEFDHKEIPFIEQPELVLSYRDQELKRRYQPDFICFGSIIVEIKAIKGLEDEHLAQILNYLHGTGDEVGLLVNFGHYPRLEYKRFVL